MQETHDGLGGVDSIQQLRASVRAALDELEAQAATADADSTALTSLEQLVTLAERVEHCVLTVRHLAVTLRPLCA